MNSISITLDLPDSRMSGHAKGNGRWTVIKRTKAMRESAHYHAVLARQQSRARFPWKRAKVSYQFIVPDNRRRDAENMRHGCKPYIDGIVDAGIITGDHWQVLESGKAVVVHDPAMPRVVITLSRVEGGGE